MGQGGRPKGSTSPLPRGTVELVKIAKQAEKLGIKTDEAWGVVLGVMRGEISGRYVGDRLKAAFFMLEQEIGKATQRVEVSDKREDGVYRAEIPGGQEVYPSGPPELPN